MTFDICMKFLSQYALHTLFLCNTFVRCHSCEDVLSIRDCVRKCLETFSSRSTILALYYKSTSMEKKFSSAPAQKFRFVCMCMCVSKRKILLAMQERERENGKRRKKLFSPLVDWILRNFKISLKPLFELHFQSTLLSY